MRKLLVYDPLAFKTRNILCVIPQFAEDGGVVRSEQRR
jgi:hypothetical protein